LVNRTLLAGLLAAIILIIPATPAISGNQLIGLSPAVANVQTTQNSINRVLCSSLGINARIGWESVQSAISVDVSTESRSRSEKGQPFFKSLLIPGWGQLTQGKRLKAYTFFAVEASLIASLIAFNKYQGWLEDDYRTFAQQHAGVNGDRDHNYYVDIGNWQDQEAYNEKRLRDRQFDLMYTNANDSWNWDSEASRLNFRSMRISADRASQKSLIVVGVMILNHLFSAVDASGKTGKKKSVEVSSSPLGGIKVGMYF